FVLLILPTFGFGNVTPALALTVTNLLVFASLNVIGIASLRIRHDPFPITSIKGMRGTSESLSRLPKTLSSVEHMETNPLPDFGRAIAASIACIGVAFVLPWCPTL